MTDPQVAKIVAMCSELIGAIPFKASSTMDVFLYPAKVAVADVLSGKVSENEVLGIAAKRAMMAASGYGQTNITCRVVGEFIEIG